MLNFLTQAVLVIVAILVVAIVSGIIAFAAVEFYDAIKKRTKQ